VPTERKLRGHPVDEAADAVQTSAVSPHVRTIQSARGPRMRRDVRAGSGNSLVQARHVRAGQALTAQEGSPVGFSRAGQGSTLQRAVRRPQALPDLTKRGSNIRQVGL